jgi:hypothetical protein
MERYRCDIVSFEITRYYYILQKRWYIYDAEDTKVYGAIEVNDVPWRVKQWKRINHDVEPGMQVVRIEQSCVDMAAIYREYHQRVDQSPFSRSDIESAIVRSLWISMEYMASSGLSSSSSSRGGRTGLLASRDLLEGISRKAECCLAVLLHSVTGTPNTPSQ